MTLAEFREQWKEQAEPHARVRWARMYWQLKVTGNFGTPTDAARALNVRPNSYAPYERQPGASKFTPLNHQFAIKIGRKFGVDWTWLLTGEGSPFDGQLPEPQERVIRAMSQANTDQQEKFAQMIELFVFGKTGTDS